MIQQPELDLYPAPKRRELVGVYSLMRQELFRCRREGRNVYHPRTCRAAVLEIVADGEWHGWFEICHALDVGTYNLVHLIDRLVRWGYLEQRKHYLGSDAMFPTVPPARYQGFQWAYRRTPATGSGETKS